MFVHNFFEAHAVWFNPLGHKEQAQARHYLGAIALGVLSLGILPAVYGLTHLLGRCCLVKKETNATVNRTDQLAVQTLANQAVNPHTEPSPFVEPSIEKPSSPVQAGASQASLVESSPYPFPGIDLTTEDYESLSADKKLEMSDQLKELKKAEFWELISLLGQIRFLSNQPRNRLLDGLGKKEWARELGENEDSWQPEEWITLEKNLQLMSSIIISSTDFTKKRIKDVWQFCLNLPVHIDQLKQIKEKHIHDLVLTEGKNSICQRLEAKKRTMFIQSLSEYKEISNQENEKNALPWTVEDFMSNDPIEKSRNRQASLNALALEIQNFEVDHQSEQRNELQTKIEDIKNAIAQTQHRISELNKQLPDLEKLENEANQALSAENARIAEERSQPAPGTAAIIPQGEQQNPLAQAVDMEDAYAQPHYQALLIEQSSASHKLKNTREQLAILNEVLLQGQAVLEEHTQELADLTG